MRDTFLEMVGDGAVLETARFQNPQTLAWLALALRGLAAKPEVEKQCLERLKQFQLPSGAVVFSTKYPAAFWPTPLALFAWGKRAECQKEVEHAVQFLLATTGRHSINKEPEIVSHDTSLRGWPYIADTHSWTEPTSLGLIALAQHGVEEHERCAEARAMLLNRQLPDGGWNSGNVKVYGNVLEPLPESTGIVLEALAGHVDEADVSKSLAYMAQSMEKFALR